jgi:AcrR family transcriptional regulator
MRRVAEQMNGSTTLVTHYFKDRDSLISFANERTFNRWRTELEELATGDPSEALLALLDWALPTSREGVRFARALISITDYAYTNEVVSAALYSWSDWYWRKVRDIVARWAESTHDGPPVQVDRVVDTVRALFNGINLSMLQGEAWTAVGEDAVELVLSVITGMTGRDVAR